MMRSDENVEKVRELVKKDVFFTVVQQSKYGPGCLTVEVPRSHTHTHSSPLHK